MGFIKFARVFRFIGLFLGLNVLATGFLYMNISSLINIEDLEELLADQASLLNMSIEELLATWYTQGLVITIIGGILIAFGIACFVIYGINKNRLYSDSSSSYPSYSNDSYDNNSSSSIWPLNNDKLELCNKRIELYGDVFKDLIEEIYKHITPEWVIDYDVDVDIPRKPEHAEYDFVAKIVLYVIDEMYTSTFSRDEMYGVFNPVIKKAATDGLFGPSYIKIYINVVFDQNKI